MPNGCGDKRASTRAKEPSTTGQGSEKMQQPSAKDNPGAGQNRPTNQPADQRSNSQSGK